MEGFPCVGTDHPAFVMECQQFDQQNQSCSIGGEISYAFYLCHLVILHWLERYLGETLIWVISGFVLSFG